MAEDEGAVLQDRVAGVPGPFSSSAWEPDVGGDQFEEGVNANVGPGHQHSQEVPHIQDDQKHERNAQHGVEDAHHLPQERDRIDLPIACKKEESIINMRRSGRHQRPAEAQHCFDHDPLREQLWSPKQPQQANIEAEVEVFAESKLKLMLKLTLKITLKLTLTLSLKLVLKLN